MLIGNVDPPGCSKGKHVIDTLRVALVIAKATILEAQTTFESLGTKTYPTPRTVFRT